MTDAGYTTPSQMVPVDAGGTASSDFVLTSEHSRNPLLQPFTTTSIWNRPIGSDAQYMPANLIPASLYTLRSDQHVIVMTPTAPLTPIVENTAGPSGLQGQRCDTSGALLVNAPIPADFEVLSTDQNNPLTALAADGHTLIQGEPFALCTAGGAGTLDYYDTKNVDGDIDGDGLQGWDGGSHLSALGGTIRLGELVPGSSIDHALQIDVDAPNLYKGTAATCWVPPASRCDIYGPTSYGGTNPSLAMGALLALPPTLDLDSLGLDAPGLILAKAFQDYGAYIANDASRSVNNPTPGHLGERPRRLPRRHPPAVRLDCPHAQGGGPGDTGFDLRDRGADRNHAAGRGTVVADFVAGQRQPELRTCRHSGPLRLHLGSTRLRGRDQRQPRD